MATAGRRLLARALLELPLVVRVVELACMEGRLGCASFLLVTKLRCVGGG